MSFVAINVLTVPAAMRETLEQRFANRAGEVDKMDGFEAFELLRPVEGQDAYLVYTRWDSQASFQAWLNSQAFGQGHAQASADGPAATGSTVWTFEVAQSKTRA
ncbi:MAG: antibiotic biosynthesis monooxygenase [Actinomycetota bacterium]|nr:antibiotic biosynthesis monooxygenase [Actinomycetota bacterium]